MTDIFTPQQQLISHAHQNFLANRKEKIYLQTSLALANAGLLANLAQAEKNLLVVCRNQQDMVLKKQLLLFHHPDAIIFSYPPFDNNVDIIHQRINCLFALLQTSKTIIVITCYQALLPALPPPDVFLSQPIEITSGQTYQMTELLKKLLLLGYNQTSEVRRLGDMVRHGGIIDIFAITPSPHHFPIRIDFFGEQIDNIYYFSPLDQRRLKQFGNIEKIKILPISEIPLDDESKKNFLFHLREELLLSLPADGFEISQLSKYDLEYYQPLFFKQTCHFFDYVKKNFILFFHGISVDNIAQHYNLAESHYQDKCEEYKNQLRQTKKSPSHHGVMLPPLPPKKFLLSPDRWQKKIKQYFCLTEQKNDMPSQPINSPEKISTIELMAKPLSLDWQRLMVMHDENDAPSLQEKLLALIKKSPTSILVAAHNIASLHRWQKLLQGDDLPPVVVVETAEKNFSQLLSDQQKKIMLAVLPLQHGEEWQNLTIITDHDIFQVEFQWSPPDDKKINKTKINKLIKDITTLKKNDLITHLDYGIGQFLGLKPITAGDRVHDCVALVYRGGDKLYLPIENLDRLQRYGDLPDPPPSLDNILDKLGSSDWQARVAKTRQRIKQLAQKLAKNAALRQTIKADPLCPADSDYLEFASLFPYPETRDQEQAILAVKNDLAKNKPMDRLICGDVGFGKTEVALRASFCAVMANKQVLVITPTTLLARQHYHHFIKRFKNFATRIKQMSRLVSPPTAKKIKQDINQGTVDIVIGTHGLLHPSIAPHNLGLVIIDEEHHFGVKQKERAKQLAKNVHLLSMSATPIPRSLQLSLHGIKDLSLIATPPSNRLPIKTWVKYLEPFDLKRAIKNEIARNGQVFLVAPRIDQLPVIKKSLQDIIPDMTITIAHGQMPSDAIDQAMTDFADNKYHGLLSTNIIESGLDLPNVNSIIIFHGDQFGLAQLYQLRGRVGRSHKQSYCFITYPKDKPISHNAKKRLELLDDLHHLGAGFLLASHDLDMRGAGNLLGEEQSGHIKEVGIELYQKMVMHEIANLAIDNKTTSQPDQPNTPADKIKILPDWSPHIVLPLAVALPENYIPDDMVRLSLYKELSESLDEKNLLAIEESLTDRFGAIPIETKNLLTVIELKQLCYQARIAELKISPHSISVMFHDNQVNHPEALFKLLKEKKASLVKETIGNKTIEKIIFRQFANDDKKMIALSKNLLALLININQPSPQ